MTESRTGQDSPRLDPFDFWRQVYEANELAWTKAMKDVMTTQSYAESQGKMLETFLAFQKIMRDGMTAQLNSLNIPTRDDVSRLGELLVGLEEKVDQLQEQLASLDERLARQTHVGGPGGQAPGAFEAASPKAARPPAGRGRPTPEAPGSSPREKTDK